MIVSWLIIVIALPIFAQTEINSAVAKDYLNQTVVVVAKVGGVRESPDGTKPHYINLGKDYPNQDLTLVVFGIFAQKYPYKLNDLQGKSLKVRGKITDYKGRLQIKEPEILAVF